MNLLEETISKLNSNGKKTTDVEFVRCGSQQGTWAEFASIAKNIKYKSGSDSPVIRTDLVVVGIDWWLQRIYDHGRVEYWEFVSPPEWLDKPNKLGKITY